MTRESFQVLLETLQVHDGHHIIPFKKKLLFSIWMLSKPESFLSAGDRFNIPKSTSHNIFFEVVQMISNLRNELIRWPNETERIRTSHILQARSGIPGIIGAIDGCHIPIKAPPNNPIDYYNRNDYHSIVLQGVCNERLEFINVFVGTPGRVHDARVFRISPLYERLIAGNELLSNNEHLLGDAAYPLHTFLLKPYRDNGHLRERESRFNTRMSSVRSLIERSFALLKNKFRRLKFLDMSRMDMTPVVIMAACVLHNFILKNEGNDDNENYNIDVENNMLDEIEDEHFNRDNAAQIKRDYIAAILH